MLSSQHDRLVSGAPRALNAVPSLDSKRLAGQLPEILAISDKTSVIGKDKTASLLCKLVEAGY